MGRMIDAENLKLIVNLTKDLKLEDKSITEKDRERLENNFNVFLKMISDEPTAFDQKKVIEELKDLKNVVTRKTSDGKDHLVRKEDAIKIVKRGGVHESDD